MITTKKTFFSSLVLRPKGCLSFGASMLKRYVLVQFEGKAIAVHRLAYRLHFGRIPKGRDVDHDCPNRWCANWKHLVAVTREGRVRRDRMRKLANPPKPWCVAEFMDRHGLSAQDLADCAGKKKTTAAGWRQGGYPNDVAEALLRGRWPDFPPRP